MSTVCKYAIIRFLPFIETGEFANVGIVLVDPKTGYWGYKLAPATFPRVKTFFEELDQKVYRKAMEGLQREMHTLQRQAHDINRQEVLALVQEVTRVRETLLRFGELRTILTHNPEETLDDLYNRFVGRNFVTKAYREEKMAQAIRQDLKACNLDKHFRQKTFEAKLRKITLPLVREYENDIRIMKPLAFDQNTPSMLIEHGERWKNKIQWLLENDVLDQNKILLPIEAPTVNDKDLKEAFVIAQEDLAKLAIELVPFENKGRIIEFAKSGLLPH